MTLLNEQNLVKISNYSEITREVTPPDWIKVITILYLCGVECSVHFVHVNPVFIRLTVNLRLCVKRELKSVLKYWL